MIFYWLEACKHADDEVIPGNTQRSSYFLSVTGLEASQRGAVTNDTVARAYPAERTRVPAHAFVSIGNTELHVLGRKAVEQALPQPIVMPAAALRAEDNYILARPCRETNQDFGVEQKAVHHPGLQCARKMYQSEYRATKNMQTRGLNKFTGKRNETGKCRNVDVESSFHQTIYEGDHTTLSTAEAQVADDQQNARNLWGVKFSSNGLHDNPEGWDTRD